MRLRYEKTEYGYQAALVLVSGDAVRVATIDKGWWEMPKRTRWELTCAGQMTRSPATSKLRPVATTYHDTLAEAKAELEYHLAKLLAERLGLGDRAWFDATKPPEGVSG